MVHHERRARSTGQVCGARNVVRMGMGVHDSDETKVSLGELGIIDANELAEGVYDHGLPTIGNEIGPGRRAGGIEGEEVHHGSCRRGSLVGPGGFETYPESDRPGGRGGQKAPYRVGRWQRR